MDGWKIESSCERIFLFIIILFLGYRLEEAVSCWGLGFVFVFFCISFVLEFFKVVVDVKN